MNVLHLMPDYVGNKIFRKTIEALSSKIDNQIVIVPLPYNSKYQNEKIKKKIQILFI